MSRNAFESKYGGSCLVNLNQIVDILMISSLCVSTPHVENSHLITSLIDLETLCEYTAFWEQPLNYFIDFSQLIQLKLQTAEKITIEDLDTSYLCSWIEIEILKLKVMMGIRSEWDCDSNKWKRSVYTRVTEIELEVKLVPHRTTM